ncbi:helix-turn-helix protein [Kribbella sp. VKM Ac-2527]|uniref:Helix-turn-helix protein n=1 Tax=Kribbella caucasensis TaxID=2512215 RepID=A0A4R6KFP0_9ACTN|nr:helix-turn-helix transcriptional regulator [Kribbella sp. VKM Ac-2527]TDO49056.1 helix-turn-helix protein [Kribbella sp. VKM Ac-2527]
MDQNAELKEFLRSRRARLDPAELGLDMDGGVRRVPGLRREEVARLAGVSVDYYSRLEQGRYLNVSDEVLDAIAQALQLDAAERTYLVQITRSTRRPRRRTPPRVQRVRPGIRRILETLDDVTPAFVFGRRLDVLAANRLARALMTDFEALPPRERNLMRYTFLDESTRELYYHHPLVGDLTVEYESVVLPADPDQTLCIYTAEPNSPSEAALKLLTNWRSPQPTPSTSRAN